MGRKKKEFNWVEDFSAKEGEVRWYEGNHFMTLTEDDPVQLDVQSCLTFANKTYYYKGKKSFDALAAEAQKYGLEGVEWNEDKTWE